jgi:hypothetical protein
MIDPADQLTQALPLDEQPAKRKRGRPSTGTAMTPAEKQRAYRERQKRNVTENEVAPADLLEKVRAAAAERIEQLETIARELRKDLTLKEIQMRFWIERAEAAERELESRDGKTLCQVESKAPGKRKWRLVGDGSEPFDSRDKAASFIENQLADGSTNKYRIVQA